MDGWVGGWTDERTNMTSRRMGGQMKYRMGGGWVDLWMGGKV